MTTAWKLLVSSSTRLIGSACRSVSWSVSVCSSVGDERHFLTLLVNGISGRKIARHAVFSLFCALSLAMWNEK